MPSLFRRKTPPGPPTFNERVASFWSWFQDVAPRFYATIEASRCGDLSDETSAKVDEYLPSFNWVYGPGAGGVGHSFTLTGEGVVHRQLLALQWLARAPKISGWTFYAARQPQPIKGCAIVVGGVRFETKEIWVTPNLDVEAKCVDLTVWHPLWERIDEKQRGMVTFLFLDGALGEYGTNWWMGDVTYGKDRLADSFPLEELADHVARVVAERGWKKYPPGESQTLFRLRERSGAFPRGDTISQSSAVPRLFRDFIQADGDLADPLAGSGADYVYISIETGFFPAGGQVAKRGEIEDALDAALGKISAGRSIGGAMGTERCYVDLLLFDGPRSLDVVCEILRAQQVPAGTMIEYFAREKRGQRIAL